MRRLGRDLSGAVEVIEGEQATHGERLAGTAEDGGAGEGRELIASQLRFSLAGMQLKLAMSMANERLTLGASAGETKWIVKLPGRDMVDLPEVEQATMAWARNAGFDVPSHFVVETSALVGVPEGWSEGVGRAFAVRRFDRRDDGSKVHQEDLCQAFELSSIHKYGDSGRKRLSHDGVQRFMTDVAGEECGRELARRVGFTIACGNGDAHLKNWSLLWGNADRPQLTPCYDFVSTIAWPEAFDGTFGWNHVGGPELALSIGGERRFGRITSATLEKHSDASQCAWAKSEIEVGILRARDAWNASVDVMPQQMRDQLARHWRSVPVLAAFGLP